MSHYGSWSVKGVDDRARAIAKEKARLKGITLGDYINNLLLEGHSEAGPRDLGSYDRAPHHDPYLDRGQPSLDRAQPTLDHGQRTPLDHLAQRIEAVEARSTLAITGIDQSVLGLLARLENTENSTSAMTAEVERMVDELRETNETLHDKVGILEADQSGQKSLEAMKALEDALGKLASHVYEEGRLTQDESMAMKGRVEAGFGELSERVEGMEVKVESTLATAAERVERAVEQAELRAEGTSRHLSERFSNIESSVATKLAKVEDVDSRMKAVEGDVSGAINSMESTLTRIQDRLSRAENTTDSALKALEGTFANLDERIDIVAQMANPEKVERLREELEAQFETLASDLRASVEQTRLHLADEIERAAAGQNPELMGALETRLNQLETADLSARIEGMSDQMSGQIVDMSEALTQRISESEDRSANAIEQIGEQVSDLSETLNERVAESEQRSAVAIEQVGEQVATAIKHVQARQDHNQRDLVEKITASEHRQETRLSDALGNVSERLAEMQTQTASAVSPVQRAIVSLAGRLEALEDFNAPPMSEPAAPALPDMPELEVDASPIELATPAAPEPAPSISYRAPEPEAPSIEVAPEGLDDTDFIAGLPDFDADTADVAAKTPEAPAWTEEGADQDYIIDTPEEDLDLNLDAEDVSIDFAEDVLVSEEDPLAELGSWDDTQQEARDSDVFAADDDAAGVDNFAAPDDLTDIEDGDAFGDILPAFEDDALAHNTDELLSELDPEAPEPIKADAADYLSRARNAAIAAATDPKAGPAPRRGRRSAASVTPKPASSRKLPLIMAASALAVAAAGAGGWVVLRGKTAPPTDTATPTIATKSTLTPVVEAAAEPVDAEPSLSGVEFADIGDAALDETLFEEEGSAAGTLEPTAPTVPVEAALPVDLPVVPAALSVEQAAINGDPVAQFVWGKARLDAKDLTVGADFIALAAQHGLPAAQYRLAKLHERGTGVPRDMTEARAWTERAANGGNVNAMHDLAVFFADGEGGPQSYAASAEWFRKAADFGVVDSQYNLALLYENGLGISPSQTEALYWYEVAAANGDTGAPGNIETLRNALPLESGQEAQRRASSWTATPADPAANGEFGLQSWDQSRRAQIRALQNVLNGLGYAAGPADGVAGAGTRTAIRAFQADNGLATTGTVDAALVETLNTLTQNVSG
ncbi:MAG: peptidoglycan-binding protein [Pseudomonadota bacterium]